MAQMRGCDVSEWQGIIDWPTVAENINFAILRTSYGCRYTDRQIRRNQQEAEAQGMLIGYYHFVHEDGSTAQQQAQFFLDCVGEIKQGQPLFLDVEEDSHGLDLYVAAMVDVIIEKTGLTPLIYMNHDFINRFDWGPLADKGCGLWLADWSGKPDVFSEPKYWSTVPFLQYTSSGSVQGISGNVDMDTFFGNADDFKRFGAQENNLDVIQLNGVTLGGGFYTFFKAYGDVDIFGLPLTNEFQYEGKTIQIFERYVMQYAPENSDPYKIQGFLIGKYWGEANKLI